MRDRGFIVAGNGAWQEVKLLAGATITTPAPAVPNPTIHHATPGWTLKIEPCARSRQRRAVDQMAAAGSRTDALPARRSPPGERPHGDVDPRGSIDSLTRPNDCALRNLDVYTTSRSCITAATSPLRHTNSSSTAPRHLGISVASCKLRRACGAHALARSLVDVH